MVTITQGQNICSKTKLDDSTNEHETICRQLFEGHVVGYWPMKRKEKGIVLNNNDEYEHYFTTRHTKYKKSE